MRTIERIDNFLDKVNTIQLSKRWRLDINDHLNLLTSITDEKVVNYWKENPDMRIGQILVNLGLVKDTMQIWLDEENDILIDQGIAPEECLYWGSCYDKDMNPIPLIYRLVKDLDSDHINNIYLHLYKNNHKLSDKYKIAFRNVLTNRNESTDIIDFIEQLWNIEVTKG